MKIIKHGTHKAVLFNCKACGCEFEAENDEYEADISTCAIDGYKRHLRYYCKCPECREQCVTEEV